MYPALANSHGEIIKPCPVCKKPNAINVPGTSELIELPILCYSCGGTIVGVWEKIVGFPAEEKKRWDEQYVESVQAEVNEIKPKKPLMTCRFCDFKTIHLWEMEAHVRKRHKTKASVCIQRWKEDLKDWHIRLDLLERVMEGSWTRKMETF